MIISNCINEECVGGCKHTELKAVTLEEMEFIDSIHKLLGRTKSLRKAIEILDNISSESCVTVKTNHEQKIGKTLRCETKKTTL